MIRSNIKLINQKFLNGFTLAEVLITLGVIGIVAAMTIPTLMKSISDVQFKSAYKKAFSAASQALMSAGEQDLLSYSSAEGDTVNHLNNFQAFMNQFKTQKKCLNNNNSECWDANGEKFRAGSGWLPDASSLAFIDDSGNAWSMYYSGMFKVFVDTNGFNKPNQWGKDRFALDVKSSTNSTSTGIPIKITPRTDNIGAECFSPNKCATELNYYATTWLYK